ncbi:uncharacterized protein LOC125312540 isoform X3 [Rhodamnia argentea]|uniref:Uncharacterized protein LOC125312540 isoform X3 n=1 Tax=Rhodamnia argentea TaxID=178133 RepID=A0ABM3HKV5_9MYRT|nr:uncharacterized protein LOC125312540 isoform X3 [Rhodamnia argentea]
MGNTRRIIKRLGKRVVQVSYELEEKVEKQRNGRKLHSNSGTANVNASDSSRKQKRGFTRLPGVWNLPPGKRTRVLLGKKMQPIGVEGGLLGSFSGPLLEMASWHHCSQLGSKLSKFDYPRIPAMEKWILHSINSKWRNWKSNLKAAHYDSSQPLSHHLKHLPERVRRDQWKKLVAFWSSKEGKKLSNINKANRAKQKIRHTLGKKSFARITAEKSRKKEGQEAGG